MQVLAYRIRSIAQATWPHVNAPMCVAQIKGIEMGTRKGLLAVAAGLGMGMLGAQLVGAQQLPPSKGKGQTVKTIASLELASQIPALSGRYLRARLRTIEPGGHGPLHSHRDLPVILYIVSGTLTLCTADADCSDLPEGHAAAEGRDVTHWATNRGQTQVTYLAVELGKEP